MRGERLGWVLFLGIAFAVLLVVAVEVAVTGGAWDTVGYVLGVCGLLGWMIYMVVTKWHGGRSAS